MKSKIELRNHQRELHSFHLRLVLTAICVVVAFIVLLSRFIYLQLVQHEHYRLLAEQNRIKVIPMSPNRGTIFDRNGVILASNYAAYTLEVVPDKVKDPKKIMDNLSNIIEVTNKDRARFQKLLETAPNFSSIPVRRRLNDVEMATFAAQHYLFPGVQIKSRLFRYYPYNELTSHVVGYLGRVSKDDFKRLQQEGYANNYTKSDTIGKIGLEKYYERELRGLNGYDHVEMDANGRSIRKVKSIRSVSGDNLILSLDANLQNVAAEAFGDKRGALVALEPTTGEVLALLSLPGFDPNRFVDGIDSAVWNALNQSEDHPLNNRAVQGVYPPASTFKPFMALAALELGKRNPTYTMNDPGYFILGNSGHVFRDWKKGGHGQVNLRKAIVESSDTYFYELANDLGIDAIHNFIKQFGLGRHTKIDLDGESPGLLPSKDWKMRRFKQKWFAGDTISVGIGQGYNLATPLQLAVATAAIANGGQIFKPYLVKQIEDSESSATKTIRPQETGFVKLKKENIDFVTDAMIGVTRPGGTAAGAGYLARYEFAGKTGTAQVFSMKGQEYNEEEIEEKLRDHGLFIAFAPAMDPKIVVSVLVENGGHGSRSAAPIARKVIDSYLLGIGPKINRLGNVRE